MAWQHLAQRSPRGLRLAERLLAPGALVLDARASAGQAEDQPFASVASDLLDLAAVRFSLSIEDERPELAVSALEVLGQAGAAGAAPGAVAFNRARVLHHLGLWHMAEGAYRNYLAIDATSPWSDEVRSLLAMLEAEAEARARRRQPRVDGWLDAAGCDELFERALEEILPAWLEARGGEAHTERHALTAELASAGDRLNDRCGDDTVSRLAAETQHASPRTIAGWQDYVAGYRLFRARHLGEAQTRLIVATTGLATNSSLGAWAQLWLAATETGAGDYPRVLDRLDRLQTAVGSQAVPRLHGRIAWNVGLVQTRSGRRDLGTASYLEAERWLAEAGFDEQAAGIRVLLAENLSTLGFEERAWKLRVDALRSLQRTPWQFTLHNVLIEASRAVARAQQGHAFSAVLGEARGVAARWGEADRVSEVEQWAGRGFLALGDRDAALGAFRASRQSIEDLDDSYDKRFLQAFAVLGELQADPGQDDGLDRLTDARGWLGEEREALLLDALRLEAVIYGREGRSDAAREALDQALALVQRVRKDREPARRESAWEAIQSVFDEAIRFEIRADNWQRALLLLENARSSEAFDATRLEAELAPFIGSLDSSTSHPPAVLAFAQLDDRTAWWLLDGSNSAYGMVPAEADALIRSVVAANRREAWSYQVRLRAYEALLAPAFATLAPRRAVVIVPDRALFAVPFAALVNGATARTVIEARVIGLSESLRRAAESWADRDKRLRDPSVFVVANPALELTAPTLFPSLVNAEQEARGIQRHWARTAVVRGREATPESLRRGAHEATIVHLATHAVRTRDGRRVLLGLAPDEVNKTAYSELVDLIPRRPPLLVLSSCASGRLANDRAGMPWPARRDATEPAAVVASLWPVDDAETMHLMVRFHEGLAAGMSARESLASAQRAALRQMIQGARNGMSWAAFQVFDNVRFEPATGTGPVADPSGGEAYGVAPMSRTDTTKLDM